MQMSLNTNIARSKGTTVFGTNMNIALHIINSIDNDMIIYVSTTHLIYKNEFYKFRLYK